MSATQQLLRFGVFELNLDTLELRKLGRPIKLAPQPCRLLGLLATHSGQIVTREEIQQQLWGQETFVDFEHGMNKCIKQIRGALNDDADTPIYVETLPRIGYRFLAPVVLKRASAPRPHVVESESGEASPPPIFNGRKAGTAAAVMERATAFARKREPTEGPGRFSTSSARLLWIALVAAAFAALIGAALYWRAH